MNLDLLTPHPHPHPRRAVAYIATGFFEEARADIEQFRKMSAQFSPESTKDADSLLVKCRRAEHEFKAQEKANFTGKLNK